MRVSVRTRPDLPRVPGSCRLCGDPIGGRRISWCSDECGQIYMAMANQTLFGPQLVALHGHACWTCGATTSPARAWLVGSIRQWSRLWESGRPVVRYGPPPPVTLEFDVDHIRPLWSLTGDERGEPRWWLPGNLQLLCRSCHRDKSRVEAGHRAAGRTWPFDERPADQLDIFA